MFTATGAYDENFHGSADKREAFDLEGFGLEN
jgi:hypothetical protein